MKVINLGELIGVDAPPEWEHLPKIAGHRPSKFEGAAVLKRLKGTDICAWFTRSGLVWVRRSDLFLVKGPADEN